MKRPLRPSRPRARRVLLLAALLCGCATDPDAELRTRYLVQCALPEGVAITADDGNEYAGDLGLAPGWSTRALNADESRWVAACILARSNYYGIPVQISLRAAGAPGARLEADADEAARFSLYEGAFFGNVFSEDAPAYACTGSAAADREAPLRAKKRICTIPDGRKTADGRPLSACGFIVTGACASKPFVQDGVDYSGQVIHVWLPPG